MIRFATVLRLIGLLALGCSKTAAIAQPVPPTSKVEKETRYRAFQIFTSSPDPKYAVNAAGV